MVIPFLSSKTCFSLVACRAAPYSVRVFCAFSWVFLLLEQQMAAAKDL